jgi:hypothetical protein
MDVPLGRGLAYGVRGDMVERWSGLLVSICEDYVWIKGAGLERDRSGVSNGLTVWMVGFVEC